MTKRKKGDPGVGAWINTLISGVLSGMVASLLFLFVLRQFRPKISISPFIARDVNSLGEVRYRFKVVNRSFRPAVDVGVYLYRDRPRKVSGGASPIHVLKPIPISDIHINLIPGRRGGDRDARHARRYKCDADLLEYWPNDEFESVVLKIVCRDGFTGVCRVVEQRFELHSSIRDGVFAFGDSLDVV